MARDLVGVLRRLRDTLYVNGLSSYIPAEDVFEFIGAQGGNELLASDALARAVGYSVSAVEIQQRGVEAEFGMTFVSHVSPQVLTQLRVLAETTETYIAVGGLRSAGENNRVQVEFRAASERQHCMLFAEAYANHETDLVRHPMTGYPPLLCEDMFVFMCECAFGVGPANQIETAHLVRLCYMAEIVKVIVALIRSLPCLLWEERSANYKTRMLEPRITRFAKFCTLLCGIQVPGFEIKEDELPEGDGSGSRSFLSVKSSRIGSAWRREMRATASPNPGTTVRSFDMSSEAFNQNGMDDWDGWYSFLRKYALVFLRKTAVLLHVKYGVDLDTHVSPIPDQPELERLAETLRLPALDDLLGELGTALATIAENPPSAMSDPTMGQQSTIYQLFRGWMTHLSVWPGAYVPEPDEQIYPTTLPSTPASNSTATANATAATASAATTASANATTTNAPGTVAARLAPPLQELLQADGGNSGNSSSSRRGRGSKILLTPNPFSRRNQPGAPRLPMSAMLSHPGIFELVGLPQNWDALIDECTRRRCPTKAALGEDREVTDPYLCLFCGDIFCAQAVCCTKEVTLGRRKAMQIGGCQQHLRKCQGNIGIFVSIRRCYVFYVHRMSGSFGPAPYVDRYGESDLGFRHFRQLFLHQKRYDAALRGVWLSHGVPNFISRKLEADINNGGWETV